MTVQDVIAIASTIMSVAIPVLGFLVRQALGRLTDRISTLEEKRDAAESALEGIREATRAQINALRETTVTREDWIRESMRMRTTLDLLMQGQARMEGRIDTGTRIAAAIERLNQTEEGRGNAND